MSFPRPSLFSNHRLIRPLFGQGLPASSRSHWPVQSLGALFVLVAMLLSAMSVARATPKPKPGKAFKYFANDAKRHSWTNSYLLSVASHYSYRANVKDFRGKTWKAKFNQALSPYGLQVVDFISVRERGVDTQIVIARRKGLVVVAFAGSEGPLAEGGFRDWVRTDFRARLVKPSWLTHIRIHKGFSVGVDVAYAKLRSAIRKHRREGDRLWMTGHSLGGALASLAALRLHRDGVTVNGIYTYAAPHVGNKQWVEAYFPLKKRTQRWVHGLDPVTRLPPAPYKPVGITNVIRAGGKAELNAKQNKIALPMFNNHSLSGYIKHIHKALPKGAAGVMPSPPKAAAKAERKREREAKKAEREVEKAERKRERAAKKAARKEERQDRRDERRSR